MKDSPNCSLHLGVALLPQLLPTDWYAPQAVAVVIDALRFTTTACVALEAGAYSIAVMSDIEAARQLASHASPPKLLCGERHCVKIPGFDLGNSPLEYGASRIAQRHLIFSTTNGTVAVEAARQAQTTLLGSLINRSAVAQYLASQSAACAWLICAGTDGEVAQEDVLTAGAILDEMHRLVDVTPINDSAQLALAAWRNSQREQSLLDQLRGARGGRNLVESGFANDVDFVAQVDISSVVPVSLQKSRELVFGLHTESKS